MSIPIPIFVDKSRNYYSILNCHRSSNEEQILTEYKILAKKYHPDTASGCKEKFQEIEESKRILLCPTLRKSYDSWLDSGISVSFETWKEKCATNMHWANAETNSFSWVCEVCCAH
ncbi:hypothetical protein ACHWQZ_G010970 [Mnemiopsis leidyi]